MWVVVMGWWRTWVLNLYRDGAYGYGVMEIVGLELWGSWLRLGGGGHHGVDGYGVRNPIMWGRWLVPRLL